MIAQRMHIVKTLTFYAIASSSLGDGFKLISIVYWIFKKRFYINLLSKIELRVEYSE